MKPRYTERLVLILLVCGVIGATPQGPTTTETAQREDVQAVYSALMKTTDSTYLIASKVESAANGTGRNMPLEKCVVFPQALALSSTEILAAARTSTGSELFPADLKLPRPYKLLTAEEMQEFRNDRMQEFHAATRNQPGLREVILGGSANPKFAGAKDLFEFSGVYFNQSRTIAVAFVSIYSSPLAGSWHWTALEKTPDGRWQVRPDWVRCMAVA